MGIYNTVNFRCPKCENFTIEAQSKAEDGFNNYNYDSVPQKTAEDIVGETVYCTMCNKGYKIIKMETNFIKLGIVEDC